MGASREQKRKTRSQEARSKPVDQERGLAKMAELSREEKLGSGAHPSPWAIVFKVPGEVYQPG